LILLAIFYISCFFPSINPRPEIKIVSESSTHALVDNGYGLGFLGGVKAMNLCIAKANQAGIAMAGVRN
jgi:LDH2 family malate/lactate/ureidoglycolate dehydrogenase